MFQENSTAAALDQMAAQTQAVTSCDTSRRQFINHAGRGLLAVGVATALPLASAEAGDLGGLGLPPATGPLDVKLPSLSAPPTPSRKTLSTPMRPTGG
ncbi:hypothetical protein [Hymenobacter sp. BRD67]|uniref:hypothetical protein n=1 Tax=Hymenobacter sp. BRD67 TaxID=2675877 RepID=UPI0020B6E764|nr:hypothetical protein [Hymenobacter sp. BRD67]